MNSKKHKLPRRILAMLLAICMFVTMFPSAMFAVEGGTSRTAGTIDGTEENPKTVSSEDGITINKYVSAGTQEGQYDLTLEAYASDQLTTTPTSKPLDIVLVLDVSGSMDDPFVEEVSDWIEVYEESLQKDQTYYIRVGQHWRAVEYSYWYNAWGYYDRWDFVEVAPTTSESDQNRQHTQFYSYETVVEGQSKMEALQEAVNGFISQVDSQNVNITEEANKHCISIVKFADDSYANRIGDDRFDAGRNGYYNYTQQVIGFSSNASALTNAVNGIDPGGATAADYGLELANTVMNQARSNSEKVVVFFTDGSPNHDNGYTKSVADDAVEQANSLKEKGVTIYSVGVFEDANDTIDNYMSRVSSNYQNVTSTDGYAQPVSSEYYSIASDPDSLKQIFEETLLMK